MGLKDWIAGSIAGPRAYGGTLGRQASDGGGALANAVFWSHGTMSHGGSTKIFDTSADMISAGFKQEFEGEIPSVTFEDSGSVITIRLMTKSEASRRVQ